jgi:hypothetical protein
LLQGELDSMGGEVNEVKSELPEIFFLTYDKEDDAADETSFVNIHEANFCANFAQYLVRRGNLQKDITILSTYKSQQMKIAFLLHSHCLLDVGSYTVDDYQGRENKIIILSTVRSNSKGQIGFVDTANRITVMLSRSTKCFYFMGNFKCLKNKSNIWNEIHDIVNVKAMFGTSIPIRCNLHDAFLQVQAPKDWLNLNGGCDRQCNNFKNCKRHECLNICHPYVDPLHERQFRCKDNCGKEVFCKICQENYICKMTCCHYNVFEKRLDPTACVCSLTKHTTCADCGHRYEYRCYSKISPPRCEELITVHLNCSHKTTTIIECGLAYRFPPKFWPMIFADKCAEMCEHEDCNGKCGDCNRIRIHQKVLELEQGWDLKGLPNDPTLVRKLLSDIRDFKEANDEHIKGYDKFKIADYNFSRSEFIPKLLKSINANTGNALNFSKQFNLFREWFKLMVKNDTTFRTSGENGQLVSNVSNEHNHIRLELLKLCDNVVVIDQQRVCDEAIALMEREFERINILYNYYSAQNNVNTLAQKEENTSQLNQVKEELDILYREIINNSFNSNDANYRVCEIYNKINILFD